MMHLGPRVAALVDGQLSPAEEERAWTHVHECASCRAAVEREGWIKRQLATLSLSAHEVAPAGLKGSLARPPSLTPGPGGRAWVLTESPQETRGRRLSSLAALGAGSAGAAMFGVIALGAAPAGAPLDDRRAPTTSLPGAQSRATASDREVTEAIETVMTAFRMGR